MTNTGVVIVGVINDGLDATLTSSLTALEVKGQTELTFGKVALRGATAVSFDQKFSRDPLFFSSTLFNS